MSNEKKQCTFIFLLSLCFSCRTAERNALTLLSSQPLGFHSPTTNTSHMRPQQNAPSKKRKRGANDDDGDESSSSEGEQPASKRKLAVCKETSKCNQRFFFKYQLAEHLAAQHPSPQYEPPQCQRCNMLFHWKSLTEHECKRHRKLTNEEIKAEFEYLEYNLQQIKTEYPHEQRRNSASVDRRLFNMYTNTMNPLMQSPATKGPVIAFLRKTGPQFPNIFEHINLDLLK